MARGHLTTAAPGRATSVRQPRPLALPAFHAPVPTARTSATPPATLPPRNHLPAHAEDVYTVQYRSLQRRRAMVRRARSPQRFLRALTHSYLARPLSPPAATVSPVTQHRRARSRR